MPKDLLINEEFNAAIANGDFVVDESTYQNQSILLHSEKGEFKAHPTTGVGAKRYLESSKPDALAREIRQEFIADGMVVNSIKIGNNLEINVDAIYDN